MKWMIEIGVGVKVVPPIESPGVIESVAVMVGVATVLDPELNPFLARNGIVEELETIGKG